MALIVGGTTVTGTQTLDATKLTGNLPAISGASLTSLNGSNISSGTVAAARVDNLSASKITSGTMSGARISGGTFGSINGSNLTGLPSPSSIVYASQAVGCFANVRYADHGSFGWGSTLTGGNVRASGSDNTYGSSSPGTWRAFGQTSSPFKASVAHRIS
tara:strand:+ start:5509 stop:5988 length:480 start_codon:yes stop_codon:yes gene_type:complete